jgi:hypothetical protein
MVMEKKFPAQQESETGKVWEAGRETGKQPPRIPYPVDIPTKDYLLLSFNGRALL